MKKWHRTVYIATLLILTLVFISIFSSWKYQDEKRKIDKLRVEDVNNLTKAYVKATLHYPITNITLNVLETILRQEGVRLHNPLAIESNVPCYKIVYGEILEGDTKRIVIQENENVDSDEIVQSYSAGQVLIKKKGSFR